MKALIHVGAFTVINGLQPEGPTDALYEARCIRFDAERAFKMGESVERACFWAKGTAQRLLWESHYRPYMGDKEAP